MAKLYPYYVHSSINNFERMAGEGTIDTKISSQSSSGTTAISKLTRFLNSNIKKLLSIENSFYASLGIKETGDRGFEIFLGKIKDLKNSTITSEATILYQLADYINSQGENDPLYVDIQSVCKEEVKNLINSNNGLNEITAMQQAIKNTISKRLNEYIRANYNASEQAIAKAAITQLMSNTTVTSKSLEYRNVRGMMGEIFGQKIQELIAEAIAPNAQISSAAIGQQLNKKGQELSGDLAFYINNTINGIKKNAIATWQIKNYDLKKNSNKTKIGFTGLETSNWEGLKDDITQQGLLSKKQFDFMTYLLVNYSWFNQVGSRDYLYTGDNGTHYAGRGKMSFIKSSKTSPNRANNEVMDIIDNMRRVLGVLAIRKITNGVEDLATSVSVDSSGFITLQKDGNSATRVVDIPPVFWSISNTYFFPTRWVLKSLLNWMNTLSTQIFTPIYASIQMGKPAYSSISTFYRKKVAAVSDHHLIANGDYSDTGLVNVGSTQGQSIVQGMIIQQKVSIIKKQIQSILNGQWVL